MGDDVGGEWIVFVVGDVLGDDILGLLCGVVFG